MGISSLIPYITSKYPSLIVASTSFEYLAGRQIFIDCNSVLRRSLYGALNKTLEHRRSHYLRGTKHIDIKALRGHILNFAARPLMLLNSALSKISDIEVVFVIGSLPPFRSKSYVNVLDTKDSRILSALVDHFEGRSEYKLCIGLRQEDVLTISERLMDRRAKVKIREDNIGRRCVEFCSSPSSYVLSDDTDVIAFGAPNVIRNYLGKTKCSCINHRDLLNAMELTRAQFIDYCILSGYKDFKVPEIYPGRAHEIIKRFKTLEDFFSSSFYVTLFNSKTGTALLKAHNMNLDEYTQQVLNFKALREELDIHKDFY
ncbi:conserved hypothetical protein [Theileria equi strain WA]|uniref:XPG-I domain-containing protein n=1 Tax=Theileria equi strain WA TaxID=1537102 RepID=L1LF24_THEEQ|nr:conserved hypothetical protein [Theileria equi strain WA]EKX73956.1 conserved hypothetical protein [Theileria equi strain WA]|eukprot:XP_004833408.1 conserved hypothetical protein [Theileria equi strain WA]